MLLPFRVFDNSGFLIHQPIPEKSNSRIELRVENFCEKLQYSPDLSGSYLEDFDADSILDEEVEEGGIDGIMGNLSVDNKDDSSSLDANVGTLLCDQLGTCYGYPMGLGLGREFGFSKPFRHVDDGDWWRFPQIDVAKISPKLINKSHIEKKKKKKKVEKGVELKCLVPPKTQNENPIPKQEKAREASTTKQEAESPVPKANPGLLLKLNCDEVAKAWSDRGPPFFDEVSGQEIASGDLHNSYASCTSPLVVFVWGCRPGWRR